MGDVRELGSLVLDEHQLDRLELVLSGFLTLQSLRVPAPSSGATLLDAENTPVAEIRDGTAAPRQTLARGYGTSWRPDLRTSAQEIATRSGGAVAVLPLAAPPHTEQIAALMRAAVAVRPTAPHALLVILASRGQSLHETYRPNSLTDVALAIRDDLRTTHPNVVTEVVVLPWPADGSVALQELRFVTDSDTVLPLDVTEHETSEYPVQSRSLLPHTRRRLEHRGAVVLFTGLSGSGKSTIARALSEALLDRFAHVDLLDGDVMRRRVSSTLGFDRAARNQHVVKIGEIAIAAAQSGCIAIAAPIAPFDEARQRVRAAVPSGTPFLLVYVSTPLEVCEARDRKGLYARARAGEVKDFTGISSPFEVPHDADLVIDASITSVGDAVADILKLVIPRVSVKEA